MLQELLKIFRPGDPFNRLAGDFSKMLDLACGMTMSAGEIFFGESSPSEDRTALYKRDVKVNKLERSIRRGVVAHLSLPGNRGSIPYCLVLMSLVKDVERLGDYAKNLSEVADFYDREFPDDKVTAELRQIRAGVEEAFKSAPEILKNSDREGAMTMIQEGLQLAKRSDGLLIRIAASNHPSDLTTALALGARYYKRIGAHIVNLLTSVVMPIHKLDYFDEDAAPDG